MISGTSSEPDVVRQPPHVAMLATPGMGHLIPMVELAKRLASRNGVTATLYTFASTTSPMQQAFLSSLPPTITPSSLPPVDLSDLPPGSDIEMLLAVECARSVPALTEKLSSLKRTTRLVAFITDMFGVDSFDAACATGVQRRCLFMPVNLHGLSLLLHVPELATTIPGGFKDVVEPVQLPGCVPIPGPDIIPPLHDRSSPGFQGIVHLAKRIREADTILVNTFDAVEPEVAKLLRQPEPDRPKVYPIGPLLRTNNSNSNATDMATPREACLQWLDRQPSKSVIFISFGSAGALPIQEMRELALGLECSGQRFLWVVRSSSDDGTPSEYFFNVESKKDPISYLPEGFIERTKDIGLVVPSWAPQTEVLAHKATGGFLTHCGWNSILESLVHGVPMVAWPLFAEQGQNAVMLAEGVQAAIRVPKKKDKEAIASIVRELMEGKGMGSAVRTNVAELQKAANESVGDGGASTTALDEVVLDWAGGLSK